MKDLGLPGKKLGAAQEKPDRGGRGQLLGLGIYLWIDVQVEGIWRTKMQRKISLTRESRQGERKERRGSCPKRWESEEDGDMEKE